MTQRAVEKGTEQNVEQTREGQVLAPPVDILENEHELVIVADIPGVEPERIKLDVQPPDFKIEARQNGAGADAVTYVRSFHIEERVDTDKVNAQYTNGVLTVRVPKSSAAKPRRIEVKSA